MDEFLYYWAKYDLSPEAISAMVPHMLQISGRLENIFGDVAFADIEPYVNHIKALREHMKKMTAVRAEAAEEDPELDPNDKRLDLIERNYNTIEEMFLEKLKRKIAFDTLFQLIEKQSGKMISRFEEGDLEAAQVTKHLNALDKVSSALGIKDRADYSEREILMNTARYIAFEYQDADVARAADGRIFVMLDDHSKIPEGIETGPDMAVILSVDEEGQVVTVGYNKNVRAEEGKVVDEGDEVIRTERRKLGSPRETDQSSSGSALEALGGVAANAVRGAIENTVETTLVVCASAPAAAVLATTQVAGGQVNASIPEVYGVGVGMPEGMSVINTSIPEGSNGPIGRLDGVSPREDSSPKPGYAATAKRPSESTSRAWGNFGRLKGQLVYYPRPAVVGEAIQGEVEGFVGVLRGITGLRLEEFSGEKGLTKFAVHANILIQTPDGARLHLAAMKDGARPIYEILDGQGVAMTDIPAFFATFITHAMTQEEAGDIMKKCPGLLEFIGLVSYLQWGAGKVDGTQLIPSIDVKYVMGRSQRYLAPEKTEDREPIDWEEAKKKHLREDIIDTLIKGKGKVRAALYNAMQRMVQEQMGRSGLGLNRRNTAMAMRIFVPVADKILKGTDEELSHPIEYEEEGIGKQRIDRSAVFGYFNFAAMNRLSSIQVEQLAPLMIMARGRFDGIFGKITLDSLRNIGMSDPAYEDARFVLSETDDARQIASGLGAVGGLFTKDAATEGFILQKTLERDLVFYLLLKYIEQESGGELIAEFLDGITAGELGGLQAGFTAYLDRLADISRALNIPAERDYPKQRALLDIAINILFIFGDTSVARAGDGSIFIKLPEGYVLPEGVKRADNMAILLRLDGEGGYFEKGFNKDVDMVPGRINSEGTPIQRTDRRKLKVPQKPGQNAAKDAVSSVEEPDRGPSAGVVEAVVEVVRDAAQSAVVNTAENAARATVPVTIVTVIAGEIIIDGVVQQADEAQPEASKSETSRGGVELVKGRYIYLPSDRVSIEDIKDEAGAFNDALWNALGDDGIINLMTAEEIKILLTRLANVHKLSPDKAKEYVKLMTDMLIFMKGKFERGGQRGIDKKDIPEFFASLIFPLGTQVRIGEIHSNNPGLLGGWGIADLLALRLLYGELTRDRLEAYFDNGIAPLIEGRGTLHPKEYFTAMSGVRATMATLGLGLNNSSFKDAAYLLSAAVSDMTGEEVYPLSYEVNGAKVGNYVFFLAASQLTSDDIESFMYVIKVMLDPDHDAEEGSWLDRVFGEITYDSLYGAKSGYAHFETVRYLKFLEREITDIGKKIDALKGRQDRASRKELNDLRLDIDIYWRIYTAEKQKLLDSAKANVALHILKMIIENRSKKVIKDSKVPVTETVIPQLERLAEIAERFNISKEKDHAKRQKLLDAVMHILLTYEQEDVAIDDEGNIYVLIDAGTGEAVLLEVDSRGRISEAGKKIGVRMKNGCIETGGEGKWKEKTDRRKLESNTQDTQAPDTSEATAQEGSPFMFASFIQGAEPEDDRAGVGTIVVYGGTRTRSYFKPGVGQVEETWGEDGSYSISVTPIVGDFAEADADAAAPAAADPNATDLAAAPGWQREVDQQTDPEADNVSEPRREESALTVDVNLPDEDARKNIPDRKAEGFIWINAPNDLQSLVGKKVTVEVEIPGELVRGEVDALHVQVCAKQTGDKGWKYSDSAWVLGQMTTQNNTFTVLPHHWTDNGRWLDSLWGIGIKFALGADAKTGFSGKVRIKRITIEDVEVDPGAVEAQTRPLFVKTGMERPVVPVKPDKFLTGKRGFHGEEDNHFYGPWGNQHGCPDPAPSIRKGTTNTLSVMPAFSAKPDDHGLKVTDEGIVIEELAYVHARNYLLKAKEAGADNFYITLLDFQIADMDAEDLAEFPQALKDKDTRKELIREQIKFMVAMEEFAEKIGIDIIWEIMNEPIGAVALTPGERQQYVNDFIDEILKQEVKGLKLSVTLGTRYYTEFSSWTYLIERYKDNILNDDIELIMTTHLIDQDVADLPNVGKFFIIDESKATPDEIAELAKKIKFMVTEVDPRSRADRSKPKTKDEIRRDIVILMQRGYIGGLYWVDSRFSYDIDAHEAAMNEIKGIVKPDTEPKTPPVAPGMDAKPEEQPEAKPAQAKPDAQPAEALGLEDWKAQLFKKAEEEEGRAKEAKAIDGLRKEAKLFLLAGKWSEAKEVLEKLMAALPAGAEAERKGLAKFIGEVDKNIEGVPVAARISLPEHTVQFPAGIILFREGSEVAETSRFGQQGSIIRGKAFTYEDESGGVIVSLGEQEDVKIEGAKDLTVTLAWISFYNSEGKQSVARGYIATLSGTDDNRFLTPTASLTKPQLKESHKYTYEHPRGKESRIKHVESEFYDVITPGKTERHETRTYKEIETVIEKDGRRKVRKVDVLDTLEVRVYENNTPKYIEYITFTEHENGRPVRATVRKVYLNAAGRLTGEVDKSESIIIDYGMKDAKWLGVMSEMANGDNYYAGRDPDSNSDFIFWINGRPIPFRKVETVKMPDGSKEVQVVEYKYDLSDREKPKPISITTEASLPDGTKFYRSVITFTGHDKDTNLPTGAVEKRQYYKNGVLEGKVYESETRINNYMGDEDKEEFERWDSVKAESKTLKYYETVPGLEIDGRPAQRRKDEMTVNADGKPQREKAEHKYKDGKQISSRSDFWIEGKLHHRSDVTYTKWDEKNRPIAANGVDTYYNDAGKLTKRKDNKAYIITYDKRGDPEWHLIREKKANGDEYTARMMGDKAKPWWKKLITKDASGRQKVEETQYYYHEDGRVKSMVTVISINGKPETREEIQFSEWDIRGEPTRAVKNTSVMGTKGGNAGKWAWDRREYFEIEYLRNPDDPNDYEEDWRLYEYEFANGSRGTRIKVEYPDGKDIKEMWVWRRTIVPEKKSVKGWWIWEETDVYQGEPYSLVELEYFKWDGTRIYSVPGSDEFVEYSKHIKEGERLGRKVSFKIVEHDEETGEKMVIRDYTVESVFIYHPGTGLVYEIPVAEGSEEFKNGIFYEGIIDEEGTFGRRGAFLPMRKCKAKDPEQFKRHIKRQKAKQGVSMSAAGALLPTAFLSAAPAAEDASQGGEAEISIPPEAIPAEDALDVEEKYLHALHPVKGHVVFVEKKGSEKFWIGGYDDMGNLLTFEEYDGILEVDLANNTIKINGRPVEKKEDFPKRPAWVYGHDKETGDVYLKPGDISNIAEGERYVVKVGKGDPKTRRLKLSRIFAGWIGINEMDNTVVPGTRRPALEIPLGDVEEKDLETHTTYADSDAVDKYMGPNMRGRTFVAKVWDPDRTIREYDEDGLIKSYEYDEDGKLKKVINHRQGRTTVYDRWEMDGRLRRLKGRVYESLDQEKIDKKEIKPVEEFEGIEDRHKNYWELKKGTKDQYFRTLKGSVVRKADGLYIVKLNKVEGTMDIVDTLEKYDYYPSGDLKTKIDKRNMTTTKFSSYREDGQLKRMKGQTFEGIDPDNLGPMIEEFDGIEDVYGTSWVLRKGSADEYYRTLKGDPNADSLIQATPDPDTGTMKKGTKGKDGTLEEYKHKGSDLERKIDHVKGRTTFYSKYKNIGMLRYMTGKTYRGILQQPRGASVEDFEGIQDANRDFWQLRRDLPDSEYDEYFFTPEGAADAEALMRAKPDPNTGLMEVTDTLERYEHHYSGGPLKKKVTRTETTIYEVLRKTSGGLTYLKGRTYDNSNLSAPTDKFDCIEDKQRTIWEKKKIKGVPTKDQYYRTRKGEQADQLVRAAPKDNEGVMDVKKVLEKYEYKYKGGPLSKKIDLENGKTTIYTKYVKDGLLVRMSGEIYDTVDQSKIKSLKPETPFNGIVDVEGGFWQLYKQYPDSLYGEYFFTPDGATDTESLMVAKPDPETGTMILDKTKGKDGVLEEYQYKVKGGMPSLKIDYVEGKTSIYEELRRDGELLYMKGDTYDTIDQEKIKGLEPKIFYGIQDKHKTFWAIVDEEGNIYLKVVRKSANVAPEAEALVRAIPNPKTGEMDVEETIEDYITSPVEGKKHDFTIFGFVPKGEEKTFFGTDSDYDGTDSDDDECGVVVRGVWHGRESELGTNGFEAREVTGYFRKATIKEGRPHAGNKVVREYNTRADADDMENERRISFELGEDTPERRTVEDLIRKYPDAGELYDGALLNAIFSACTELDEEADLDNTIKVDLAKMKRLVRNASKFRRALKDRDVPVKFDDAESYGNYIGNLIYWSGEGDFGRFIRKIKLMLGGRSIIDRILGEKAVRDLLNENVYWVIRKKFPEKKLPDINDENFSQVFESQFDAEIFGVYFEILCDNAKDAAGTDADSVEIRERLKVTNDVLSGKATHFEIRQKTRFELFVYKKLPRYAIMFGFFVSAGLLFLVPFILRRWLRGPPRRKKRSAAKAPSEEPSEPSRQADDESEDPPAPPASKRKSPSGKRVKRRSPASGDDSEPAPEHNESINTSISGMSISLGELDAIANSISNANKGLNKAYDRAHVILNPYGTIGEGLGRQKGMFPVRNHAGAGAVIFFLIGLAGLCVFRLDWGLSTFGVSAFFMVVSLIGPLRLLKALFRKREIKDREELSRDQLREAKKANRREIYRELWIELTRMTTFFMRLIPGFSKFMQRKRQKKAIPVMIAGLEKYKEDIEAAVNLPSLSAQEKEELLTIAIQAPFGEIGTPIRVRSHKRFNLLDMADHSIDWLKFMQSKAGKGFSMRSIQHYGFAPWYGLNPTFWVRGPAFRQCSYTNRGEIHAITPYKRGQKKADRWYSQGAGWDPGRAGYDPSGNYTHLEWNDERKDPHNGMLEYGSGYHTHPATVVPMLAPEVMSRIDEIRALIRKGEGGDTLIEVAEREGEVRYQQESEVANMLKGYPGPGYTRTSLLEPFDRMKPLIAVLVPIVLVLVPTAMFFRIILTASFGIPDAAYMTLPVLSANVLLMCIFGYLIINNIFKILLFMSGFFVGKERIPKKRAWKSVLKWSLRFVRLRGVSDFIFGGGEMVTDRDIQRFIPNKLLAEMLNEVKDNMGDTAPDVMRNNTITEGNVESIWERTSQAYAGLKGLKQIFKRRPPSKWAVYRTRMETHSNLIVYLINNVDRDDLLKVIRDDPALSEGFDFGAVSSQTTGRKRRSPGAAGPVMAGPIDNSDIIRQLNLTQIRRILARDRLLAILKRNDDLCEQVSRGDFGQTNGILTSKLEQHWHMRDIFDDAYIAKMAGNVKNEKSLYYKLCLMDTVFGGDGGNNVKQTVMSTIPTWPGEVDYILTLDNDDGNGLPTVNNVIFGNSRGDDNGLAQGGPLYYMRRNIRRYKIPEWGVNIGYTPRKVRMKPPGNSACIARYKHDCAKEGIEPPFTVELVDQEDRLGSLNLSSKMCIWGMRERAIRAQTVNGVYNEEDVERWGIDLRRNDRKLEKEFNENLKGPCKKIGIKKAKDVEAQANELLRMSFQDAMGLLDTDNPADRVRFQMWAFLKAWSLELENEDFNDLQAELRERMEEFVPEIASEFADVNTETEARKVIDEIAMQNKVSTDEVLAWRTSESQEDRLRFKVWCAAHSFMLDSRHAARRFDTVDGVRRHFIASEFRERHLPFVIQSELTLVPFVSFGQDIMAHMDYKMWHKNVQPGETKLKFLFLGGTGNNFRWRHLAATRVVMDETGRHLYGHMPLTRRMHFKLLCRPLREKIDSERQADLEKLRKRNFFIRPFATLAFFFSDQKLTMLPSNIFTRYFNRYGVPGVWDLYNIIEDAERGSGTAEIGLINTRQVGMFTPILEDLLPSGKMWAYQRARWISLQAFAVIISYIPLGMMFFGQYLGMGLVWGMVGGFDFAVPGIALAVVGFFVSGWVFYWAGKYIVHPFFRRTMILKQTQYDIDAIQTIGWVRFQFISHLSASTLSALAALLMFLVTDFYALVLVTSYLPFLDSMGGLGVLIGRNAMFFQTLIPLLEPWLVATVVGAVIFSVPQINQAMMSAIVAIYGGFFDQLPLDEDARVRLGFEFMDYSILIGMNNLLNDQEILREHLPEEYFADRHAADTESAGPDAGDSRKRRSPSGLAADRMRLEDGVVREIDYSSDKQIIEALDLYIAVMREEYKRAKRNVKNEEYFSGCVSGAFWYHDLKNKWKEDLDPKNRIHRIQAVNAIEDALTEAITFKRNVRGDIRFTVRDLMIGLGWGTLGLFLYGVGAISWGWAFWAFMLYSAVISALVTASYMSELITGLPLVMVGRIPKHGLRFLFKCVHSIIYFNPLNIAAIYAFYQFIDPWFTKAHWWRGRQQLVKLRLGERPPGLMDIGAIPYSLRWYVMGPIWWATRPISKRSRSKHEKLTEGRKPDKVWTVMAFWNQRIAAKWYATYNLLLWFVGPWLTIIGLLMGTAFMQRARDTIYLISDKGAIEAYRDGYITKKTDEDRALTIMHITRDLSELEERIIEDVEQNGKLSERTRTDFEAVVAYLEEQRKEAEEKASKTDSRQKKDKCQWSYDYYLEYFKQMLRRLEYAGIIESADVLLEQILGAKTEQLKDGEDGVEFEAYGPEGRNNTVVPDSKTEGQYNYHFDLGARKTLSIKPTQGGVRIRVPKRLMAGKTFSVDIQLPGEGDEEEVKKLTDAMVSRWVELAVVDSNGKRYLQGGAARISFNVDPADPRGDDALHHKWATVSISPEVGEFGPGRHFNPAECVEFDIRLNGASQKPIDWTLRLRKPRIESRASLGKKLDTNEASRLLIEHVKTVRAARQAAKAKKAKKKVDKAAAWNDEIEERVASLSAPGAEARMRQLEREAAALRRSVASSRAMRSRARKLKQPMPLGTGQAKKRLKQIDTEYGLLAKRSIAHSFSRSKRRRASPSGDRGFLIQSSRGLGGRIGSQAKENSMQAFTEAAESKNIDMVEFDIQLAQDGRFVVVHGAGKPIEASSEQAALMGIPMFKEVMGLLIAAGKKPKIDIKDFSREDDSDEIIRRLVEALLRYKDQARNIYITSFNPAILEGVKDEIPDLRISYPGVGTPPTDANIESEIRNARRMNADLIAMPMQSCTPKILAAVKADDKLGLDLYARGAGVDREALEGIIRQGVFSIGANDASLIDYLAQAHPVRAGPRRRSPSGTNVFDVKDKALKALIRNIYGDASFLTHHVDRSTRINMMLGQRLKFNPRQMQLLEYASCLHDIGVSARGRHEGVFFAISQVLLAGMAIPLMKAYKNLTEGGRTLKDLLEKDLDDNEREVERTFTDPMGNMQRELESRDLEVSDELDLVLRNHNKIPAFEAEITERAGDLSIPADEIRAVFLLLFLVDSFEHGNNDITMKDQRDREVEDFEATFRFINKLFGDEGIADRSSIDELIGLLTETDAAAHSEDEAVIVNPALAAILQAARNRLPEVSSDYSQLATQSDQVKDVPLSDRDLKFMKAEAAKRRSPSGILVGVEDLTPEAAILKDIGADIKVFSQNDPEEAFRQEAEESKAQVSVLLDGPITIDMIDEALTPI
ncbi:glycerophosphodiester phosphodiesterase family protein, partial [Candidatus Omnitrophota bacterium]